MSVTRSSPIQVAAYSTTYSQGHKLVSTSWSKISVGPSHVLAIKSNNTLWAWGINTNGQLGDSTTVSKSSPVQVYNANYTWTEVSAGLNYSIGLRGDNLLFVWGLNSTGQLGQTDTVNRSSPTQVGSSSWTTVSAGATHVVAIRSDKKLFTWGLNSVGQLGTSDYLTRSSPVQVGNSSWITISAGNTHTTAIDSNYQLYTWGDNTVGTLGYDTPTQITNSWISIAGNAGYTVAIRNDGLLFAWGLNNNGQLGDSTTINRSSPVQIGVSSWTLVSANAGGVTLGLAGGPVFAIRSDGTLWGWGFNTNGQLGNGDFVSRSSPVQVAGGGSWTTVSVSYSHTVALKTDGKLYIWGGNAAGQLGLSDVATRSSPTQVGNSSWTKVSAGSDSTYAITLNSLLFSWGSGTLGQLGLNDNISRSSPVQVGTSSWTNVFANGTGWAHAININNKLFGWGLNNLGQLGYNNAGSARSSPVQISSDNWSSLGGGYYLNTTPTEFGIQTDGSLWAWGSKTNLLLGEFSNASYTYSWTQISAGPSHTAAIRSDGRLYTWGKNDQGQLGINDTVNRSSPVQISVSLGGAGEFWNKVSANGSRTVAVLSDSTLYAWGNNAGYVLGDSSSISRSVPTQILGGGTNSWSNISAGTSHTIGIKTDGKLYTWGDNTYQQLGQGSTVALQSSPVLVGTSSWSQISSYGNHSLAININNKLYGWGENTLGQIGQATNILEWSISTTDYSTFLIRDDGLAYAVGRNNAGQLGDSSVANKSSPVQLSGGGSWTQIVSSGDASGNNGYSVGIKTNGTLYTWGSNNLGQLGNSSLTSRSSPLVVGSNSWVSVSTYLGAVLAIRSDYTLWSWGKNDKGQLGLLDVIARSSPVQIGTSSWSQVSTGISYTMAIRLDGTLWTWGNNSDGQLGLSDTVNRYSPSQVGTSSWTQVTCYSSNGSGYAIRSDGTTWAWGLNANGQLGLNDTINRSSPVQISITNKFDSIAVSGFGALAKLTNGTLWTWGLNSSGQLGLNDTVNRSSPVQVGTSSWVSVSAGYLNAYGILISSSASNGLQNVYSWGINDYGQLGAGDVIWRSSPTQVGTSPLIQLVSSPTQIGTSSWTTISAGLTNSFAIRSDYKLFSFGDNSQLQSGYITPATALGSGENINGTAYIRNSDYTLLAWGANDTGQIGDGTVINRSSPVQLGLGFGYRQFTKIAKSKNSTQEHSLAIKSDGTLWAWGTNISGKLGDGTTTNKSSPVQVGILTNWSDVAAGPSHSVAIKTDGSLWGWGDSLGAGLLSWSTISSGSSHTLAVRSDGQLFVWGKNDQGQLGTNNTVTRSSPTQIGTESNWSKIVAGTSVSAAIKSDGSLFTWGLNVNGALGIGDTINRSSPTQINSGGTSISWSIVSAKDHMLGITTDNKIYAWGNNNNGQLGLGDTANRTTPVEVTSPIGGYSAMYIDGAGGAGPYYITDSNPNLALGNNWTIEYWYYRTATYNTGAGGQDKVVGAWNPAANNNWACTFGNSGYFSGITFFADPWWNGYNSYYAYSATINTPIPAGGPAWTHIAFTSVLGGSTTDVAVYINGTRAATTTVNFVIPGSSATQWIINGSIIGYVSNIRYSNTAIYTGTSFTVPTGPLTVRGDTIMCITVSDDGTRLIDIGPYKIPLTYVSGSTTRKITLAANQYPSSFPTKPTDASRSFVNVGAGINHSLAIRSDSGLFTWGKNDQGQLGSNTTITRSSPVQVGTSSWSIISAGNSHSTAITTDSKLYSWGLNNYGQLGIADYINRSSPVQVSAGTSYTNVYAGTNYNLALTNDNIVWGWGDNSKGNLGINNVLAWSALNSGISIRSNDYALMTWGSNTYGSLGISDTLNRSSPVQVGTSSWAAISSNTSSTYAITTDGKLFAWGRNEFGQLGQSDTVTRSSPVQVGALTTWSKVTVGLGGHVLATTTAGALYAWGNNVISELGTGDTVLRSSPVQIGTSSWSQISAGTSYSMGITSTGGLFGWGKNDQGQIGTLPIWTSTNILNDGKLFVWGPNSNYALGLGDTITRSSPVQLTASEGTITTFSNSDNYAAIATNGTLWVWGRNQFGQLGLGDTVTRSVPTQLGTLSNWISVSSSAAGYNLSIINSLGELWVTGNNPDGQLGDNTTISRSSPIQISAGTGLYWTRISNMLYNFAGIKNDGSLWTWGYNQYGGLGLGDIANRSSPVQVTAIAGASWSMVVTSQSTFGITTLGRLYAWGLGLQGQLGLGNSVSRSSPAQIGTSSWSMVNISNDSAAAITVDGKLFTWGNNAQGQLGSTTTTNRASPLQVGASSWTFIAYNQLVGVYTGLLTSDSTNLYIWGANNVGQLGVNDTINRSSPVQVPGGAGPSIAASVPIQVGTSSWTQVSAGDTHTLAIRYSNGSLFTWGKNDQGQLGNALTTSRSSPIQVGTSSWSQVNAGTSISAAITTVGALWTWGLNSSGQLGLAATNSRSSPFQIGASSWSQVNAGNGFMTGVTINITAGGNPDLYRLYTWGNNNIGQLGLNDTILRSSPVQIGSNFATLYSTPVQITSSPSTAIANNFSGFFDGASTYVIATTAALNLSGGAWTAEFWMNHTGNYTSWMTMFSKRSIGTVSYEGSLNINDGSLLFYNGTIYDSGVTPAPNTWHHVAYVYSGTTITIYLNGVNIYSATVSVTDQAVPLTIGSYQNAVTPTYAQYFNGYISNFRLVKGVAVYTGNFTVPTSILTATQSAGTNISAITGSQTSLLTLQNVYTFDNSTTPLALSNVGTIGVVNYTNSNLITSPVVSAGESHISMIIDGYQIFDAGDNSVGQLGDNTTVSRSSLAQIGYSLLSITRSSPTQIDSGSWSKISAGTNYSIALKSDGTLWTWGINTDGYLGDGTTYTRRMMAQIGSSSYTNISAGPAHNAALKIDNTAWTWGLNNIGQLGDSTIISRSSPVQVNTGLVTSWNAISAGGSHTVAIDATNNSAYAWGRNTTAQLGDNTVISRSAPVQVYVPVTSNYSYQFNGTTQYLEIANNASNQMGTGDWTAEAWIYITTYSTTNVIFSKGGATTDWFLATNNSNGRLFTGIGTTDYFASTGPVVSLNSWAHVALVRSGTTLSTYLNGVLGNTQSGITQNFASLNGLRLGRGRDSSTNYLTGYISNARLVKGTALYTTGFYPSTGALTTTSQGATASQVSLLTAQSATIVDNSSNAFAITNTGTVAATTINPFGPYYSGSFNGTNQYLRISNSLSASYDPASSDFTMEAWVYPTSNAGSCVIMSRWGSNGTNGWIFFWSRSSNGLPRFETASTFGSLNLNSSVAISLNVWSHLAVVRSSSTLTIYMNGASVASTTISGTASCTSDLLIGAHDNGTQTGGAGYISNVRMVVGVAVYTGSFSRPTNNLLTTQFSGTNINSTTSSQTKLLILQSATIVDNSINALAITNTGSVSVTTAVAPFTASTTGSLLVWDSVQAGASHTIGTANNTLYAWGSGNTGVLGLNDAVTRSAPTQVGSIWSVLEKTLSSPVQVGTANSWSLVGAGAVHTIARATDFTLWTWGQNNVGQLGDSTTIGKSSPTQVAGNVTSYSQVTAGSSNIFVINAINGLLYGVGLNTAGQLGDNTVVNRSGGVQIFTATMTSPLIPIRLSTVSGSSYTQVQAGLVASAIDSAGRLFAWGTNTNGQVGNNTTISRSSPVQVGGIQLTYINSPVQVGTSSYSQVSASSSHTLAIDTNSLLYAWGKTPANGQSVNRSSPVQIGSNSWLNISTGNDLSLAVDITQTLYAWGLNTNYQLGSPNFYLNQSVTSPVAIGTLALGQGEASSGGAGNGGFIKNI